ncbi:hypothetical protein Airi02_073030 [Actinoallomurus iriomotensis]|uniref:Uncharacterized protein n=1 Tax=Actinoallomurus iriomotensis TaxID=478107 RepID=A0A9W6S8M4_9ACTN|nr:hypothetical protein Airi02_073030 [Actinoallomurus iriomotensis]
MTIKDVGEPQGSRPVALYKYYDMLRSSEAIALTKHACHLPRER